MFIVINQFIDYIITIIIRNINQLIDYIITIIIRNINVKVLFVLFCNGSNKKKMKEKVQK